MEIMKIWSINIEDFLMFLEIKQTQDSQEKLIKNPTPRFATSKSNKTPN